MTLSEEEVEFESEEDSGVSYLAKTCHGVPIHLLTLTITLQAHRPIGKFTHFPDREIEIDIHVL